MSTNHAASLRPLDASRAFATADNRGWRQLFSTLLLYVLGWATVGWAAAHAPAFLPLLLPFLAGLYVRVFVLQHDAGHGCLVSGRRANDLIGHLLGVLTMAPYGWWRRTHAMHHASTNHLEKREELGYIWTLTKAEYLALDPRKQRLYRVYRNPFVLVLLGVPFQFFVWHRLPLDTPEGWRAEWAGVVFTDLALAGLLGLAWWAGVLWPGILLFIAVAWMAVAFGGALFLVQHSFPAAWYARPPRWSYETAALRGSSHLELPALLAWFSADIGLHHVHHLNPMIPNYRLREAMEGVPALRDVPALHLGDMLAAASCAVVDEDEGRMLRFDELEVSPGGAA